MTCNHRENMSHCTECCEEEHAKVYAHVQSLTAEVARITELGATTCDENEKLYEQVAALRQALSFLHAQVHGAADCGNPDCEYRQLTGE